MKPHLPAHISFLRRKHHPKRIPVFADQGEECEEIWERNYFTFEKGYKCWGYRKKKHGNWSRVAVRKPGDKDKTVSGSFSSFPLHQILSKIIMFFLKTLLTWNYALNLLKESTGFSFKLVLLQETMTVQELLYSNNVVSELFITTLLVGVLRNGQANVENIHLDAV